MGYFMKRYFERICFLSQIAVDEQMVEKFETYYEMLIEKNKTLNLTAITKMEDVVLKHFIDSISISHCYDFTGKEIIDVGTGAGFPGVPLAIYYPDTHFVLMDSVKKKLDFVDSVLEKLNINNVTLIHGRAETFGRDEKYREQFDYCVSRAVAPLPVLLELCTPFIKVGGRFIAYKSHKYREEFDVSNNAANTLGCEADVLMTYTIPDTDFYRVFIVFLKKQILAKKYPRQAGRPKKNPL